MNPIRIFFSISISLLLMLQPVVAQQFKKEATIPNWVTAVSYTNIEEGHKALESDHVYLLLNDQVNTQKAEMFVHRAVKLINQSGVQEFSKFEIELDPSYETIIFHSIDIIRQGKRIDKLKHAKFKELQRESGLESNLYNGEVTYFTNLIDVRNGDVVEYSYTRKGRNPIYKGLYNYWFNLNYSQYIHKLFVRIVAPTENVPEIKAYKCSINPQFKPINSQFSECVISKEKVKAINLEANVPSWFYPTARVQVGNSNNWSDVVEWGIRTYAQPAKEKIAIKEFVDQFDEDNPELKANRVIEYVQNNIRYFGNEGGMNSHKPHAPSRVIEQGFGDCKDKSLLLSMALTEIGIKAYPMLVNTYKTSHIQNELPAINAFDHCVVAYQLNGNFHFVDPTQNFQGGDIKTRQFYPYGKGLIIFDGNKDLNDVNPNSISSLKVEETFESNGLEMPGKLLVHSVYLGDEADNIRSFLNSNSTKEVSDAYLEYYARSYSTIQLDENPTWVDHSQDQIKENKLEVWESYIIDELWHIDSNKNVNLYSMLLYPDQLSAKVDLVKTPNREMPYRLNFPLNYEHRLKIKYHQDWNINEKAETLSGPGFKHKYRVKYQANSHTAIITHKFEHTKPYLEASEYAEYRKKVENMLDYAGFESTYNNDQEDEVMRVAPKGVTIAVVVVILFFVGLKLYRDNFR